MCSTDFAIAYFVNIYYSMCTQIQKSNTIVKLIHLSIEFIIEFEVFKNENH